MCGQVFCKVCCNQIVSGKIINVKGDLRVCNYCSKVVLSYLQSADISSDLKFDLQALEDDLSNKFVGSSSSNSWPCNRSPRKVSVGYQEERLVSNPNVLSNADRKNILQQSNSLKALYEDMISLFHHVNNIKGSELLASLNNNQKFSKQQAISVLNAMIEAGFIVPAVPYENTSNEPCDTEDTFRIEFVENLFYKLPKFDEITTDIENQSEMPNKSVLVCGVVSLESEDIIPPSINSVDLFSNNKDQELQSSILSTVGSKPILEFYCEHEEMLLNQLLRNENLDATWSRILINLCARIAHTIHPEFCQILDSMDIRNFVSIKVSATHAYFIYSEVKLNKIFILENIRGNKKRVLDYWWSSF